MVISEAFQGEMWGKFVFSRFLDVLWEMWGKFQNKLEFLIHFDKNEISGTRKHSQKPFRIYVRPTDTFQNRQNRKGVVHRNGHF